MLLSCNVCVAVMIANKLKHTLAGLSKTVRY